MSVVLLGMYVVNLLVTVIAPGAETGLPTGERLEEGAPERNVWGSIGLLAVSAALLAKYPGLAPGAPLPKQGGRLGADMHEVVAQPPDACLVGDRPVAGYDRLDVPAEDAVAGGVFQTVFRLFKAAFGDPFELVGRSVRSSLCPMARRSSAISSARWPGRSRTSPLSTVVLTSPAYFSISSRGIQSS
jgi:hypothetical protein